MPSNPLPQAGRRDHGEPSADGASSVSRLSSASKRRGGANAGGGTGPGPHHRCQEKAETLTRPCWEGAGPEQVQSQPLYPLCQHLSGGARALFLSSLLLIHTLERCCGSTSSPSLHPATNPDPENHNRTQFNNNGANKRCSRCLLSPLPKEQNYKAPSS